MKDAILCSHLLFSCCYVIRKHGFSRFGAAAVPRGFEPVLVSPVTKDLQLALVWRVSRR